MIYTPYIQLLTVTQKTTEMNTHYKVRLNPDALIVRVEDEREEVIYGTENYLPVKKAERIVEQLNNGEKLDFDNLN